MIEYGSVNASRPSDIGALPFAEAIFIFAFFEVLETQTRRVRLVVPMDQISTIQQGLLYRRRFRSEFERWKFF
jgi:hypothetical protein